MSVFPKAVLKQPHSKRWRDHPQPLQLAERLDYGVFTAVFSHTLPYFP